MSKSGIIIIIYNPASDSYSAYAHGLAPIYDEPGFASPIFVVSTPAEVKEKLRILNEVNLLKDSELILENLVNASRPFTSGDIVDETSGTIPLIDRLKSAIKRAESLL